MKLRERRAFVHLDNRSGRLYGDGEFMISGENTRRFRRLFKPEML
jgi:hypothetical protein